MRRSPSYLVCPLVCSLHCPVALYRLRVMSYCQLSCFPTGLSSPLSSCLVLGACYIIQPVDLFHSSAQHCVPINQSSLSLPRLWLLPVRQEGEFILNLNEHLHLKVHFMIKEIG